MQVAAWCSAQFELRVFDILWRYKQADLCLIPEIIKRYDELHGCSSTVTMNTVPVRSFAPALPAPAPEDSVGEKADATTADAVNPVSPAGGSAVPMDQEEEVIPTLVREPDRGASSSKKRPAPEAELPEQIKAKKQKGEEVASVVLGTIVEKELYKDEDFLRFMGGSYLEIVQETGKNLQQTERNLEVEREIAQLEVQKAQQEVQKAAVVLQVINGVGSLSTDKQNTLKKLVSLSNERLEMLSRI